MKILPLENYFLLKTDFNNNTARIQPNFGISFSGKNILVKDVFVSKSMSGKEFRKLNDYMVDLYTGEPMLTQNQLDSMRDKKMFKGSISKVVKRLRNTAKKYLTGTEAEVFTKIEEAAKVTPDITLPELFNSWYATTRSEFRKTQRPYFDKIKRLSKKLPPENQEKFKELMKITHNKLYDKPISQEFNYKNFMYQVKKGLATQKDKYKKQILTRLIALDDESLNENSVFLSKSFIKKILVLTKSDITKEKYFMDKNLIRIKIIEGIKQIAQNNKDTNLVNLCEQNIKLLQHEKVIVPFSNKNFVYELLKVLGDSPDEALKNKILAVAQSLPQSTNSVEALILKYHNSDANTIGYRLFSPSLVSVEHLVPASMSGSSSMTNCALAKMKYNNERSSEPLYLTFQRHNKPEAQQFYTNKLIKLVDVGLVSKEDAIGQLQTIEQEGHIKLNYDALL